MPTLIAKTERQVSCEGDLITTRYDDGTRMVFRSYGGGESYRKQVVIPRELALQRIRQLRQEGWRWNQIHPLALAPENMLQSAHYGGPGRPFHNPPFREQCGRRFLAFYQSGGYDI